MSASVKNMSLYIPHVFANIGKDKIIEAFEKLDIGKIKNIDYVSKMGKNSEAYNAVYIHFENWYNNTAAQHFQDRVKDPKKEARLVYEDPWFWIVLENKAKKHTSGDRKSRIDVGTLSNNNNKKEAVASVVPVSVTPVEKEVQHQVVDAKGLTEEDYQHMDEFEKEIQDLYFQDNEHMDVFDKRYVQILEQENQYMRTQIKNTELFYCEKFGRSEHQTNMLLDEICCLKNELEYLRNLQTSENSSYVADSSMYY